MSDSLRRYNQNNIISIKNKKRVVFPHYTIQNIKVRIDKRQGINQIPEQHIHILHNLQVLIVFAYSITLPSIAYN